jgi:hypothetical protein
LEFKLEQLDDIPNNSYPSQRPLVEDRLREVIHTTHFVFEKGEEKEKEMNGKEVLFDMRLRW